MTRQRIQHLFWLVLILWLAMVVRFNGLLSQSLWIDEGFTWNLTQYGDLFAILRQDVHPPLYFVMVDAWVELAGTSIFSMRYFSLLPSLLSVVLVYQLAQEIASQRDLKQSLIPLIAAIVMAVAEAETFLSQEVRSYTWHVLFASTSMLGFLRWHRTGSRQHLALWGLGTIALVYTFYLGAFIGVAQGITILLFSPIRKKITGIAVLVVCALSLAPWLLLAGGEQTGNISRAEWIQPDAFDFWLDDFRTKYFTRQWALTITLFVAGLFTYQKKQLKLHQTGIFLLLCFGIPLILTLLLNFQVPTYQPRRVSQIVPAIVLLVAFGAGHLSGRPRWILVAIIAVYGTFSTDFWRYKQPWQQMVDQTAHYITAGTPMLFELGGDDYAPRYHYAQALTDSYDFLLDEGTPLEDANVLIGLTTWRHLEAETYSGNMPAIINSADHWWLFYWSSDTGALEWLDTFGFRRTATLEVDFNPDVYLYRYDRVPENPITRYENGLALHEVIVDENDLAVELLWSTDNPLDMNYTMSVVLLDESGQVIAQHDSEPFLGQSPTTGWNVGDLIYDYKPLDTSQDMLAGDYQLALAVYQLVGGEIVVLKHEGGDSLVITGDISSDSD